MQTIELTYNPLPKQAAFHRSPARFKAYVGGMGAGKTLCGVYEGLKLSLDYPGNFGLIGAQTYPQLRDTTMKTFFEAVPSELIAIHLKGENKIVLHNGSEIIFRTLDEASKLKGTNLGWFWIDEAADVPEDIFLMLQSRLRRENVHQCGFITSNPAGKNWIWKRFAANSSNGKAYFLVQAKTSENVHLPDGYLASLSASWPDAWRKRYLEAEFLDLEGLVYPEFQTKHVVDPFPIPDTWRRIRAIDHGYRAATCCLWAAVDYDADVWITDEYYQAGLLVSANAENILAKSGPGPIRTVIDPSAAAALGTKTTVLEEYQRAGIYCDLANHDFAAGTNRVREYLRDDPVTGEPNLRIFSNCHNLINELQTYRWADRTAGGVEREQAASGQEDHAVDALRYLVMALPAPPQEPKPELGQRSVEWWVKKFKQDRRGRAHGHV